jgi:ParB family transcriptional regulator, chromosome partitioning protein
VSQKRRGLGRGLGALIPEAPAPPVTPALPVPGPGDRPVDVFFPGSDGETGRTTSAADSARAAVAAARETLAGGRTRGDGTTPVRTGGEEANVIVNPASSPVPNGEVTLSPSSGAIGRETGAGRELLPVPGVLFAEVPVDKIRPNPRQPRQVFEEEALDELIQSVREVGVLQPVVVRPVSDDKDYTHELIMGERRWRAVREAGMVTIPAIIRSTSDDALLRDALLENLHRAQLNPLEEAAAYQQLLDDFGCTHEDLASRIGRSRPQISNTIRLLRLPPLVQRRVAAGVLSAGHARALLGLDDGAAMERLAQRIVAAGLSVRAVEEILAVGDETTPKPTKKRMRSSTRNSELDEVANRLGDRLETRVSVSLGRSRGKLTIDFASVEDLNRIISLMAPDAEEPSSTH